MGVFKEIISETGKRSITANSAKNVEMNKRFNTNFQVIESTKPPKNNKTGYKGVWQNPHTGKYHAYITLHYKMHRLGRFKKLEDAVEARRAAEEELFAPLIAEKNEQFAR